MMAEEPQISGADGTPPVRQKSLVALVVVAVFVLLLAVKLVADGGAGSGDASITSVHNDAVADFEAAVASGKPVYVLFHSLSCEPCIEISQVADRVMPDYEGRVVFVNAITGDPSGAQLASSFEFQYIPTSFFLAPGGEQHDAFTGAMDEAAMRGYLDALLAMQ